MNHYDSLWFMTTIHWTPRQAAISKALVDCGYYGNQSEVGRAAMERLIATLTPAQRRSVALRMYAQGEATLSLASEVADLPLQEMRALLRDEGILQEGAGEPLEERRRKNRSVAKKYE